MIKQAAYRDETRRSSTSDRTFENLGNWSLFLRDSRDEAELAQYLGLQHKHDLRHFALSWPVIKTWIRAPHEQTSALKGEINRLIQDNKDDFSSIEDPYEVWPQQDQESVEQASVRRTHIMAWHLLQMSKDTEEYIRSSDVQNFYRTRRFRGELAEILELDMPLDLIFHPRPQLTSWRNELVEKFDRCWTILAYVSWIPYMISWEKTLEYLVSTTTKAIIYDTKMLTSTRPRPSHLGFFQTSSQGQNPIVPIQVRVNWERDKNSLEKVGLRHLLAKIAQDGRSFPPTDQILTWDPRQCKRGSSFRDNIRRAMSCSIFGFNLCDMALLYQSDTEHTFYELNTFRIQWKVLKGIFSDPDNSNFVIRVVLDIHDPRNGDIYETTELPPVN